MTNGGKPEWYRLARTGMNRELAFTEEMKHTVTNRIARRKPVTATGARWKYAIASLFVVIAAAAWLYGAMDERAGWTQSGTNGVESPETTQIPLPYEPAPDKINELQRMAKSSVTITGARTFEGLGTMYSYRTSETDEVPHLAISFDTALDETPEGVIYDFGYGLLSQFRLEASTLFGEERVRIIGNGCMYQSCVYTNWVRFEQGRALIDLHVDVPSKEADLDGDGRSELVATTQSRNSTVMLYRLNDGEIEQVEVFEALGLTYPDSIVFDPLTNALHAVANDDIRSYKLSVDGAKLVQVETPATAAWVPDFKVTTFDGVRSAILAVGGYDLYGQWEQAPGQDFGLYLPVYAQTTKSVDGEYDFELMKGRGSISFRSADTTMPLTYESDLAGLTAYAGSVSGDTERSDYFLLEYDDVHRVYAELRYKLADMNKVRPIMLAMMASVKFNPNP